MPDSPENELKAAEASREALTKAAGITTPTVLDHLLQLGIRAETRAGLPVVPLVEVAWADGELDTKAWLARRPVAKLLSAWMQTVQAMRSQLATDAARLKTSLLAQARAVADASGRLFGIGSKVSKAEAEMLGRLEAAFG
jgi:hypothetical protein